jgi:hypothetical protein
VGNLHLPFIEATSLGASGSGTLSQGSSGSSVPVEPVGLAYHLRELTVSAIPILGSWKDNWGGGTH